MLLFYVKAVPFKMLPFDNKPEFGVVLDMPEGTALGRTINTARLLADKVREIPEVVAIQTYAGTAKPFDFNGMVRHYYLRQKPWQARGPGPAHRQARPQAHQPPDRGSRPARP